MARPGATSPSWSVHVKSRRWRPGAWYSTAWEDRGWLAAGVTAMRQSDPGQRGFGLVEVMLAVLVGSLGMLGLAASQVLASRMLDEARQRSQATLLAVDMHARLRANAGHRGLYPVHGLGAEPAPVQPPDCRQVSCSPADLARFDLDQWARQLTGRPGQGPDAAGTLRACVDVSGRLVTVALAWRGRGVALPDPPPHDCPAGESPGPGRQRGLRLSSWGRGS
ncbi:MAG: type IV pilus modification protein PilV [Haliea sp.]|nr:type IV pilus modification protein PilV [Haliea sp.]